jgi:hypothetical protein
MLEKPIEVLSTPMGFTSIVCTAMVHIANKIKKPMPQAIFLLYLFFIKLILCFFIKAYQIDVKK